MRKHAAVFSMRMGDDLKAALEVSAAAKRCSVSTLVNNLLRDALHMQSADVITTGSVPSHLVIFDSPVE